MDYEGRLRRAREEMRKRDIGMMFLPSGANLWYLADIPRREPELTDTDQWGQPHGDCAYGAYIGADSGLVLVCGRLGEKFLQSQVNDKPWIEELRVIDESENAEDVIAEVVKNFNLKGKGVSLDDRAKTKTGLVLQHMLPGSALSVASDIIAPMRMIKDADEITAMQKVGEVTDEVYGEAVKFLKTGVTVLDVRSEIDYQFAKRGVEYNSFMTSIRLTTSGKVWQMRGVSTGDKLESGNAITFDMGACYNGYCSDFGRTAFVGDPPAQFVKAYDVVIEAQAAAIEAMVSGTITAMQLDSVARNIIEKSGCGKFGHRLGHGIGATVHEPPSLYRPDETVLVSGMTTAVEPMILMPDGYSCRVEDVVLVTDKGGVPLTNFHKKLSVIGA